MAIVTLSEINDTVVSTLNDYGPPTFRQNAQQYQEYEIFSRWWQEEKVLIQDGIKISRRMMLDHSTDNTHVGVMDEDNYAFSDHLKEMQVDWVYSKKHWMFGRREYLKNRGKSLLVNIIEPRRADALLNIAHDIESKGWAAPSGPSDTTVPWGVAYWIVKNATQGFNGGLPSGFTTLAGIDLSLYPNFKNYTDKYVDVTEDDFVYRLNRMKLYTKFKSPLEVGGNGDVILNTYRNYTNFELHLQINKACRDRNDNLGVDMSAMEGGGVMYAGGRIVPVAALNSDTSNPFYMICHDTFHPVVGADDFLVESEVIMIPGYHDWYAVWIDTGYNYVNDDRRRNGVMYK